VNDAVKNDVVESEMPYVCSSICTTAVSALAIKALLVNAP
jgi:hypothetical protein